MGFTSTSRHIVVLRKGQFCTFIVDSEVALLTRVTDWFDVMDGENRPLLTEREVLRNLQAVVTDADKTPLLEVGF